MMVKILTNRIDDGRSPTAGTDPKGAVVAGRVPDAAEPRVPPDTSLVVLAGEVTPVCGEIKRFYCTWKCFTIVIK